MTTSKKLDRWARRKVLRLLQSCLRSEAKLLMTQARVIGRAK